MPGERWVPAWLRADKQWSPSLLWLSPPRTPPHLPSGPGLARWQEQGNAVSCMLLVYFEKPPVSSPAWGHVVAAGLCSQDGFRAGPCPPFPTHSQPFSSSWPGPCEPHILAPSLGATAPTRRGRRSGTQRGPGVGASPVTQQHCRGSQMAVVIRIPHTASFTNTSVSCGETQSPGMLARPGGQAVPWLRAGSSEFQASRGSRGPMSLSQHTGNLGPTLAFSPSLPLCSEL